MKENSHDNERNSPMTAKQVHSDEAYSGSNQGVSLQVKDPEWQGPGTALIETELEISIFAADHK